MTKPVLLEGTPGVGKTSLVMALGQASGHHVVRINLSEQTVSVNIYCCSLVYCMYMCMYMCVGCVCGSTVQHLLHLCVYNSLRIRSV